MTYDEQKVWQRVRDTVKGVTYEWKNRETKGTRMPKDYTYSLDEHIVGGHVAITCGALHVCLLRKRYMLDELLKVITEKELKAFMASFLEAPKVSGLPIMGLRAKPSELLNELTYWHRTHNGYGY